MTDSKDMASYWTSTDAHGKRTAWHVVASCNTGAGVVARELILCAWNNSSEDKQAVMDFIHAPSANRKTVVQIPGTTQIIRDLRAIFESRQPAGLSLS